MLQILQKNSIFVLTVVGIGLLLWWIAESIKAPFLFLGIFCGFMFFNVTLSTMANAISGAKVKMEGMYLRLLLLTLSAIFITIGILI
jgi:hypothetical protein